MRRPLKYFPCKMPAFRGTLRVLILNGSLKHGSEKSNTQALVEIVLRFMRTHAKIKVESIRLSDRHIEVGLGFKESEQDKWPEIAKKIRGSDIILFATPIWWGNRSSLMQRVIERLDAFDEERMKEGRSSLYNKVAGIVITGSEDGAQQTMGSLMEVLSWMGFTLPPECAAYWVGEVGQNPANDKKKMLKNAAAKYMAKTLARNMAYYAKLLKVYPLEPRK
ncbi:MAG: NAD(P)H-dependent oxidoreductase [Candidatus Diapherotrites archaeon]|nr:NAD(P)H-dependent oxidoreductase [Candidatus Diapherotrites archaeon]